jgi:hypothetical protein
MLPKQRQGLETGCYCFTRRAAAHISPVVGQPCNAKKAVTEAACSKCESAYAQTCIYDINVGSATSLCAKAMQEHTIDAVLLTQLLYLPVSYACERQPKRPSQHGIFSYKNMLTVQMPADQICLCIDVHQDQQLMELLHRMCT